MNQRLFETHLSVADLDRSMRFYENVIGLTLGHLDEERRIALYWIGSWGESMLGLWEKPHNEVSHHHFAIEAPVDEWDHVIGKLRSNGVETKDFFGKKTTTPTVLGWMPAVSIYFDDPDGHLLEYLAMLPHEPRPDLGIIPWDEWAARVRRD